MKTKMNKQLILSFIGIMIILLSYYFIYLNYLNKAELLEKDNLKKELQIAEFEKLQENSSFYLTEIDRMQSEMNTLYREFPDNILVENCIMLTKNMEDTIDSLEISSVSLGEMEEMNESNLNNDETSNVNGANNSTITSNGSDIDTTTETLPSDTTGTLTADTTETLTSDTTKTSTADTTGTASSNDSIAFPVLYKTPLIISYKVNYNGLKEMINFIYNKNEKMSIETISVFNDPTTGDLSGNATINIYTMKGTNTTNIALDIPSILHGIENIFGSLSSQKEANEN